MSAATDEQVDLSVDLTAEVPCSAKRAGQPCPHPAEVAAKIQHGACPLITSWRPLCPCCLHLLRQAIRTELVICLDCGGRVLSEHVEVRPL